jgi:hypothetical protein
MAKYRTTFYIIATKAKDIFDAFFYSSLSTLVFVRKKNSASICCHVFIISRLPKIYVSYLFLMSIESGSVEFRFVYKYQGPYIDSSFAIICLSFIPIHHIPLV